MTLFRILKKGLVQQILAVGVLWVFAAAQPLLALLSDKQHIQFFLAHGAKGLDIVLFVVLLCCLVPVLFGLLAWLLARCCPKLCRILQVGMVFLLVLLLCLPPVKVLGIESDLVTVLLSGILAGGLTMLYVRQPEFRSYLGWLGPAVLLVPLFFLLLTPLRKLAFPKGVHSIAPPRIESQIPVVLLIFDELPISSLLNTQGKIDAEQFPYFAAFAGQSTWYRNAATVADRTAFAVPIILSSRLPDKFRTGTYSNYPDNVFTLMGGSYQVAAVESLTELCPERLCPPPGRSSVWQRQAGLMTDVKTIYLHLIAPKGMASKLPSVDKDWANFGEAKTAMQTRNQFFEQFLTQLETPHPDNTFYMMHLELPHSPWVYFPSGKQYDDGTSPDAIFFGIKSIHTAKHKYQYKSWENDWARTQGYQRHLMQLMYTDRLLGQMLERLKAKGLFDKALIMVVADHGISFGMKGDTRAVGPENDASILQVPLFVKYPHQKAPVISDIPAETIDIVPTIADVTGGQIPWHVDGVSLRQNPFPNRKSITAYGRDLEKFTVSRQTLQAHYRQPLTLKNELFAHKAPGFGSLYAIGDYPQLLGQRTGQWDGIKEKAVTARLLEPAKLGNVSLKGPYLPGFLLGELSFKPGESPQPIVDLALSLNGRIVSLSRAYAPEKGERYRFYFVVPEFAFKAGQNDPQIYVISRKNGKIGLSLASS